MQSEPGLKDIKLGGIVKLGITKSNNDPEAK